MAHVQILHLEGVANVVVELGIAWKTLLGKRIPAFFAVIDDKGHHGNVFLALEEKVVVVFRNLRHDFGILFGFVLGDDSHVEARNAAILDVRLEYEVSGARMLCCGVVFASPTKTPEVDGVEERLERGVVAREQCQEFGHPLGLGKGEPKVTVVNEVALVVFHGVHDHVEFVSDIADDRFYEVFIFCHFILFYSGNAPVSRIRTTLSIL